MTDERGTKFLLHLGVVVVPETMKLKALQGVGDRDEGAVEVEAEERNCRAKNGVGRTGYASTRPPRFHFQIKILEPGPNSLANWVRSDQLPYDEDPIRNVQVRIRMCQVRLGLQVESSILIILL